MEKAGRSFSVDGMTIIEVLVGLSLFAFVGYLALSTMMRSSWGMKKALLSISMSQSHGLTIQRLSKSGVLKQILETKLSPAELASYRDCALGGGSGCRAQFDRRVVTLDLPASDPLAQDFNGAFGRDLAACADPANCDKSFSRSTELLIGCESDSRCSSSKLVITTNSLRKSDTVGSDIHRTLEISLGAADIFTAGLNGKCAVDEGYVSEIDFASNNMKCVPASETINLPPTAAHCATPNAQSGFIYAGVQGTSFANSTDCQKLVLANWSVVSGYPSVDNQYSAPLPLIPPQPIIPGTPPEITTEPVGAVASTVGNGRFILWGDEHVMRIKEYQNRPDVSKFWSNVLNLLTKNQGGKVGILKLGAGAKPAWKVSDANEFKTLLNPPLESKFVVSDVNIGSESLGNYDAVLLMSADETVLDAAALKAYVDSGKGLFVGEIGLGKNSAECQEINRTLNLLPFHYDCGQTTNRLNSTSQLFYDVNLSNIPFNNGHWVVKNQ